MKKRPFVIDTDTGSDDVWAIIAGLRSPEIRVEAITTVCGNLPLELCVKNAKLAARAAGTYRPPVYEGSEKPLKNDRPFYAWDCHGPDGLSGMDLPEPDYPAQREAADALAALARRYAGELEIAACGPLTNIALACRKDESFARNVKRIYILGGAAGGRGNMTEQAEYNVYVDPDAARIVLDSALDAVWVSWDCAGGDAAFSGAELARLAQSESGAARFCERCIRQMRNYYEKERGGAGLAVIDSVLMLCALRPGLITESFSARCEICCDSGESYGAMRMERGGREPNARIVAGIDARAYKDELFALLGA